MLSKVVIYYFERVTNNFFEENALALPIFLSFSIIFCIPIIYYNMMIFLKRANYIHFTGPEIFTNPILYTSEIVNLDDCHKINHI